MSTVTFWDYGHLGTAEIAVSLAVMTAMDYRVRILLGQTGKQRSGIDEAFKSNTMMGASFPKFQESGMDALLRMSASNLLSKNNISDYTVPLIQDRLDWACGPEYGEAGLTRYKHHSLQQLIHLSNEYYDLVLMDTPLAQMAKNSQDLLIVVLRQNIRQLEMFFEESTHNPLLLNRPYIIVLQNYDSEQYCSISNIRRRFGCKSPMIGMPYNREYADAWNTREVVSFYRRNYTASRRQGSIANYMASVRSLCEQVLEMTGVHGMPFSNRGA